MNSEPATSLRCRKHHFHPGRSLRLIAGATLVISLAANAAGEDPLQNLPPGVFLQNRMVVPADQVAAFSRKLGGGIRELTNSDLLVQGRSIRVNVITADSDASAQAIHEALAKVKAAPFCIRRDRSIVEFAGRDVDEALARKTSYELKLVPKPDHVRYRLTVQFATVDRADYPASNALSNLLLTLRGGNDPETMARIGRFAGGFHFGTTLGLRNPKLNRSASTYEFEPAASREEGYGSAIRYSFPTRPDRYGIPFITAKFQISTDAVALSADPSRPDRTLLAPTPYWPAADPTVKALADEITRGKTTNEVKVGAILVWLTPDKNLRYAGDVGSRWGVLKVLQQKFGRCWDFADCFVALSRASGVLCREVAGWLYGSTGHVWAEYYREGQGWQQVDPTGGGQLQCGIYHIPYFTSEDGEMPILYVSMPKIEMEEPESRTNP